MRKLDPALEKEEKKRKGDRGWKNVDLGREKEDKGQGKENGES